MAKHGETKREQTAARLENTHARRAARFFAVILVFALAFTIGFVLRGNDALMKRLGVGLSTSTQVNPGQTVSGDTYDSLSARIAEVQGVLNNESLDEYDLNTTTTALINALLTEIDDPYARYLDSSRYQKFLQELSTTDYVGIGVIFAEQDSSVYVADVFTDSVAAVAGVETGDVIVAIDGVQTSGMTASEVTNAVFREAGSSIVTTWRRANSSSSSETGLEYTVTLYCSEYTEQNVGAQLSNGNVGVITLEQITQNSSSLVSDAIKSLTAQGATSFVLDLRNCPGGYLTQAVDIANLFMKSGTIVQIVSNGATTTKSVSGSAVTDAPLFVLVNSQTAATAEIIAGALQDSDRATIVGETTMGKGTMQVTRELSFGGALRYTAARYKTPLGYEIDGTGISPDISVSLEGDEDNQLALALDLAASENILAGN